jgi:hypothetical protein
MTEYEPRHEKESQLDRILSSIGLTLDDLKNKKVLNLGSGERFFEKRAKKRGGRYNYNIL